MTDSCRQSDDLTSRTLRDRAVRAAKGHEPFDLLITGGQVVDMVTAEIRAADIGIVGPLIASVHEPGRFSTAESVFDANGSFVTPGLIDTHMHMESSMITPATYAAAVVPRGVTTVVWDPHEFGNVSGIEGVRQAVEASRGLPLRVLPLAPSCVPSAPGLEVSGADFGPGTIADMLAWPDIAGLAEMMNMQDVIARDDRVAGIVQAALESGKLVCGHARGLEDDDLTAFSAAGISSDHELVSGEDLIAKLRAGLAIELRGSHDHLLPEFVRAFQRIGHVPQTVTLCTDDVFPDDLHRQGGLDDVVRRLVAYGLQPVDALRSATLNAARRLNRPDLGLIAPGRRADIAVFSDLESFQATGVFSNGRQVAEKGALTAPSGAASWARFQDTMKLGPLEDDDFRIRADGTKLTVPTIDQPRFTRWGSVEATVENGRLRKPENVTLMTVVHRHGKENPVPRTAFLTGWGNWRGAFCTSVSHDSHNLTVFGGNEADMRVAANAVISAGGGMAVASAGKIDAILPLPVCGLISEEPLVSVAEDFRRVRGATDKIVEWNPPYLVFKACVGASLACNPGPHLTDLGIADCATGEILTSIADPEIMSVR